MSESGFKGLLVGIKWDVSGPFLVSVLNVDEFSVDTDAVSTSPGGGCLLGFDGPHFDVAGDVGEGWHHCLDTGSSFMELDGPLNGFGA